MTTGLDSSFDLAALGQLRQQAAAAPAGQNSAQLQAAAQQFESLFTQMMLKSMRAAGESFKDSAFSSQQGDFHQDMFDQQLALHLSRGRGLGLAQMLIEQLGRSALVQIEAHAGSSTALPHASGAPLNHAPSGEPTTQSVAVPAADIASVGEASIQQSAYQRSSEQQNIATMPRSANVADAGVPPSHAYTRGSHDSHQGAQAMMALHAARADTATDAGTDMPAKRRFVTKLWPHAQQVAQALGVDAHAVLAQAVLETGWGRHVPEGEVASSHNLFGIKASRSWRGASVETTTLEYQSGVAVTRSERFRAYASAEDSIRDYAALLSGQQRYRSALAAGQDIIGFAQGLQRAGYATDPQYANKLIALAGQLRAMTKDLEGASLTRAGTTSAAIAFEAGAARDGVDQGIDTSALKSASVAPLFPDSPAPGGRGLGARDRGGEPSDG